MIGVGDLVVCVDASPNVRIGLPSGLVEGRAYTVTGVKEGWEGVGLLVDWLPMPPQVVAYRAERFRKILPDEPIACETEFRILLDLSKKRVSA